MAIETVYSINNIYINVVLICSCSNVVFHMLGVIIYSVGCFNLCLNLYSGTDAICLNKLNNVLCTEKEI